jgi:hypothetical protein
MPRMRRIHKIELLRYYSKQASQPHRVKSKKQKIVEKLKSILRLT